MKLKSIFFSFLFLISFNAYSQNVDEIKIKGLSNISRGTVLSHINIETGDAIPDETKIKQISSSLLNTELFQSVSIELIDSTLVILVKENPIIQFFDFIGYKEDAVLSEDIITDIKNNSNLKTGKIFIKKNLDKLIEELKSLYIDNAFYKANIKVSSKLDEQNRIGIELQFDEGEQALINKMEIKGNKFFNQEELLDLFDIGEPDFFIINYFTERDQFNKQSFYAGIESIKKKIH